MSASNAGGRAPPDRQRRVRAAVLLATLGGLGAAAWIVGSAGLDRVAAATLRIGAGGFALYCLWSLGVFVWLGGAWLAASPGEPPRRVWLFTWARMVREAVSDLLPFAQLGGVVVATRTLALAGIAPARVYASLVVDLTTEMASQLVFTLFGLAIALSLLATGDGPATLRPLILGGTAAMAAAMIGFFFAQRPVLMLAERIARGFLPGSAATMADVLAELRAIYARRRRVLVAFVLNLGAWIGSALGAWFVLRWIGAPVSLWSALSLESLIFTLRSIAFAIPGAIGVQEAAYALAAPLFGLPPETALALSLAKRARDLAIGLPTLLLWQIGEARAVVGTRPG